MRILESEERTPFAERLESHLAQEQDPRLTEIVERLKDVALQRRSP